MQITFYPKEKASKLPTSLFARITYNYNSLKIYTDLKIEPNMWDHKNQRAKGVMIGAPEFNRRVTRYRERIQHCFNRYLNENNNAEPPKEELKNLLFVEFKKPLPREVQQAESLKTFWGFFQHFIDQSINGARKTKQGNPISKNTIGNYNTLRTVLKEFEADKKSKISFERIDQEFYKDLLHYFEQIKKYKKNTIQTQFRILKTMMGESLELGYHSNAKSKKFTAPSEDSTAIYLNETELEALYNLDLSNSPRLDRVRDLFVINCYTGGRFGDLQHITTKNITVDHLNPEHQYLTYKQNKTGNTVTIPVPTQLAEILKKYDNQLPKPPSNQKFNDYIKDACEKIEMLRKEVQIEYTKGGIKVLKSFPKFLMVGSHSARRSFATNAYLSGQQTMNIMAITGHLTEKSFLKYIRVTPMEKARLFKMHSDKVKNSLKAVK